MIRRIKLHHVLAEGFVYPTGPWIADCRTYDIPQTIVTMIEGLDDNCVAVTLSLMGGHKMITAAENMAHKKGIRILWWFGPSKNDITVEGQQSLLYHVKAIRKGLLGCPGRF